MRPVSWILLVGPLFGMAASTASAQESASSFDVPAWAQDTQAVMSAAGLLVIIGAFGRWAHRRSVLTHMTDNFTPWGGVEALAAALTWIVLKTIPIQIVAGVGGWQPVDLPMGWILATDVLAAVVVLGFSIWMMRRRYGVLADSLGLRWDNPFVAIGLAALGLLATTPVQFALAKALKTIGVEIEQGVVQEVSQRSGMDLVLAVVMVVLVAPVVEEFLFRGVIQMGVRRYLGPWGAILFSSVLFASVHRDWNASPGDLQAWSVPLLILPLGLVLGYLYQRRQSLMAPIALHMLFNGFTVVVLVAVHLGWK